MGTRADFYVGRGESAEWLGSIAWDGYPGGITPVGNKWAGVHLFDAETEAEFRVKLQTFFAGRDDVTLPEQGWPWPWETSHTTDYAYAFDGGIVYACCFGHRWFRANDPALNDAETEGKDTVFPDMTSRKSVTFGKRSGLMVFTAQK